MANTNDIENEQLTKIKNGFRINSMRMKDGSTGKAMWECNSFDLNAENTEESLPKELLTCSEVIREINFSSIEIIENLELIQNFYLCGDMIESSRFLFGFVIPNSTNNWEQIIEAKDEMIPYEVLSGNLVVETTFLTNGNLICRNLITIFYI